MNLSKTNYCKSVDISMLPECYSFFASKYAVSVIFEILLGFSTGCANAIAIYFISKKPIKVCFDYIFIGSCIADFLMGVFNLPFYHLKTLVNYWPFGQIACAFWATLDSSLNTVNLGHMLLMSWCRRKSITSPKTYQNNVVIRNSFYLCGLFWLFSLIVWIPVNFSYFLRYYQTGICSLKYQPSLLEFFVTFITWLLPLTGILALTIDVIILLNFKKIRKKFSKKVTPISKLNTLSESPTINNLNTSSEFGVRKLSTSYSFSNIKDVIVKSIIKMDPQSKLSIIVTIYLAQWFPSCILSLTDSICPECIPNEYHSAIYWLTFSVAFTNPMSIIILSPNYIKKQIPS